MGIRQRWAEARRQYQGAELPDAPVTRERFSIDVEQNHSTAGLGTTQYMKWCVSVTDTVTGTPQYNSYALTRNQAWDLGNRIITKIVNGRRPIK